MASFNYLPEVLETTEPERVATGYKFTEGPLWHPDGFWYFVDLPTSRLFRIRIGEKADVVRNTEGGNGTTFDMQGRLIHCEGEGRKVTRLHADGRVEVIADRYLGGRLSRPNDVVCRSDGTIFFTDPDKRVPYAKREIPPPEGRDNVWDSASVYSVAPDGTLSHVAHCEYPNGLAFSPDERTLYVANTRSSKYIHALEIDKAGKMTSRRMFCDMNEGSEPGVPDGIKVDTAGRVYCTGPGGIWVTTPYGQKIGTIRFPEQAVNFAFGDADMKTLFCCAYTSVYTLRVKVPGNPHPWYRARSR